MATSHVPPDSDERGLLRFLDQLDTEGEDAISQRKSTWKRDMHLFATGLPDRHTPPPIFSANLLAPLIRRKAALLTEMKPELDVQPQREGVSQTARLLRQTIHAGWDQLGVPMMLEDLSLAAQVFGSAFCQITWDQEADYGSGDIAVIGITPCDADAEPLILVDPAVRHARDLDDAEYIRVRHVVSLSKARRAFPDVASRIKPGGKLLTSLGGSSVNAGSSRIKGAIEAAQRLVQPGQRAAIPRVELKEYWIADPATDADGEPLYPNGKVIVRADDVICSVAPNPYYDGRWPFEWLDNQPDFDTAWGRSELAALYRVQDTFNRLGNLYVKVMTIGSVPFIVADQNALDQTAITTLQDMGYYVLTKMATRTVDRSQPPVAGQQLQAFMQYGQGLAENIAGLMDAGGNIGTTKGRGEVRSAVMLEGLQQASQVLIRAQARRLEAFLERVGQKWISRIFQFYTTDRLMTFVGSRDEIQSYKFERQKLMLEIIQLAQERLRTERQREQDRDELRETDHGILSLSRNVVDLPTASQDQILAAIKGAWREFRFKIVPFSSLSANRLARSQMLMQLAQQAMLPTWMALQELGFENPKDLLQEAVHEAAQRQAMGIQPAPPPKGAKQAGGAKKS